MNWKYLAIGAVAVAAYLLMERQSAGVAASRPVTALEAGDPRGTVAHAIEVVSKGAKAVSEQGKRAILGETKSDQRETDKKRMVGG